MATATPDTPATMLEAVRRGQRNLGLGLVWAGGLLWLLAIWIGVQFKHPGFFLVPLDVLILAILGTIAIGVGLLQFRPVQAANDTEALNVWLKRRRNVALGSIGIAAVVLFFMIWLIAAQGMPAFPQFLSGTLFAIVGLLTGALLRNPPGQELKMESVLAFLAARHSVLSLTLVIAGAVLLLTALGLFAFEYTRTGFFQGGVGALFLGLLFLYQGLRLQFADPNATTANTMRETTLTLGSVTGLIIAILAGWRAYQLWQVQTIGLVLNADQGASAWELWVCAYVELFGLGIMFGSLSLAQTDVRTNPVMRRLLYGYNTGLTAVLLVAILVLLNVLVYTGFPYTFSWTQTQVSSLSDLSKNVLESLKEPTRIYALMTPGTYTFMDTKNLLDNAEFYNGRLQVEYVSPDRDQARYSSLVRNYPKILEKQNPMMMDVGGRGLLVVYGPESEDSPPPYVFIPESRLTERQPGNPHEGRPSSTQYNGEDVLMTELRFLAEGQKKPNVYFTQGHGEMDVRNTSTSNMAELGVSLGVGLLVERLKKDNYEVHSLRWGVAPKESGDPQAVYTKSASDRPHEIPKDAKVVVIADPKTVYKTDVIDALKKYVDGGGKLIVLTDAMSCIEVLEDRRLVYQPNGLEDLLKNYGVELDRNFVFRLPTRRGENYLLEKATTSRKSANPIALSFRDRAFLAQAPRTIRPQSGPSSFQAEVLLEVAPEGQVVWATDDWIALVDPERYLSKLIKTGELERKRSTEPLSIGVAVSDQSQKPRMVVFGDGTLASNIRVSTSPQYYALLTSSMEWLAERPGNIGIGPKTRGTYVMRTQDINLGRLIWLPLGLAMLTLLGLGTGVWVVRRR